MFHLLQCYKDGIFDIKKPYFSDRIPLKATGVTEYELSQSGTTKDFFCIPKGVDGIAYQQEELETSSKQPQADHACYNW